MPNGTGPTLAVMSALIRLGAAFALLAAALVADTSPAAAQPKAPGTRIFVTIEGQTQGKFKSEGGPQFRDRIPVLRYQYDLVAPRDSVTGLATGRRQHKGVSITKEWSAASPQIFQAITTNENLKSVLIEFFRTSPTGQEEVIGTVRLTNAHVARYTSSVSDSASSDATAGRLVDHVEFVFEKIEIANPAAKTGATDNWAN